MDSLYFWRLSYGLPYDRSIQCYLFYIDYRTGSFLQPSEQIVVIHSAILTLKVLVATIDALGHFETG